MERPGRTALPAAGGSSVLAADEPFLPTAGGASRVAGLVGALPLLRLPVSKRLDRWAEVPDLLRILGLPGTVIAAERAVARRGSCAQPRPSEAAQR